MIKVERAMILCVGCIGWSFPKIVLVSIDEYSWNKRLDEVAEEAFQKYKATQQNQDIYLVTYSYQGDIEILTE